MLNQSPANHTTFILLALTLLLPANSLAQRKPSSFDRGVMPKRFGQFKANKVSPNYYVPKKSGEINAAGYYIVGNGKFSDFYLTAKWVVNAQPGAEQKEFIHGPYIMDTFSAVYSTTKQARVEIKINDRAKSKVTVAQILPLAQQVLNTIAAKARPWDPIVVAPGQPPTLGKFRLVHSHYSSYRNHAYFKQGQRNVRFSYRLPNYKDGVINFEVKWAVTPQPGHEPKWPYITDPAKSLNNPRRTKEGKYDLVASRTRQAEVIFSFSESRKTGKSQLTWNGHGAQRALAKQLAEKMLQNVERLAVPRPAPRVVTPRKPDVKPGKDIGRTTAVIGQVTITRGGKKIPLRTGDKLREGDHITTGPTGYVSMELPDPSNPNAQHEVDLAPDSTFTVRSSGSTTQPLTVQVNGSLIWNHTGPGKHGRTNIYIPGGIFGLDGTTVAIRKLALGSYLYVKTGRASFKPNGSRSVQNLPVGTYTIATPQGQTYRPTRFTNTEWTLLSQRIKPRRIVRNPSRPSTPVKPIPRKPVPPGPNIPSRPGTPTRPGTKTFWIRHTNKSLDFRILIPSNYRQISNKRYALYLKPAPTSPTGLTVRNFKINPRFSTRDHINSVLSASKREYKNLVVTKPIHQTQIAGQSAYAVEVTFNYRAGSPTIRLYYAVFQSSKIQYALHYETLESDQRRTTPLLQQTLSTFRLLSAH